MTLSHTACCDQRFSSIWQHVDHLLAAGLATDSRQSAELWEWFMQARGITFKCLRSRFPTRPPGPPWLGVLLMPVALKLPNCQLDALYIFARSLGLARLLVQPDREP